MEKRKGKDMRTKWMTMAGVVVLAVVLACGCATTAKGPTDAEIIKANTAGAVAAAKAGDIDKLLTYYSDKFSHYEFGDKAGFKKFLDGAKDSGYLKGVEVDLSKAQTTINGEKATVGPVTVSGGFGSAQIQFEVVKEADDWKISGMEMNL